MSDTVIIIAVIALLVAVILTILFGGRLGVRWGNLFGLTAERNKQANSEQQMKATGPDSLIRDSEQEMDSGEGRQTMDAQGGGKIVKAKQRKGRQIDNDLHDQN